MGRATQLGLLSICIGLAGCAGNSDNNNGFGNNNGSTQQFAGKWSGGCVDTSGETQAEVFNIAPNGAITGTEHNNNTGAGGTFTGTVDGNGNAVITYTSAGQTVTARGTIATDGKSLRGSDSYTSQGQAHTETFYLNKSTT